MVTVSGDFSGDFCRFSAIFSAIFACFRRNKLAFFFKTNLMIQFLKKIGEMSTQRAIF
jgi:hypothetical protein